MCRLHGTAWCDVTVAAPHGPSAAATGVREATAVTAPAIRAPASSANLGAGFDALGLALATYLEVVPGGDDPAPENHPAVKAFRRAGGEGPLTVVTRFPAGRGLGFSGAAKVGGALAAARLAGKEIADARDDALRIAAELEGHADNAAASLLGGFVAVAGGHATRVTIRREPKVVVWVPDRETSTKASRKKLGESVPLDDAVFNVGRAALLVAALAEGDVDALRTATEDRLHQDARLEDLPESRAALCAALDAGAWGAWLSGSGPSVASFADPADAGAIADAVAAAVASSGRTMVLDIDQEGATEVTRP